MSSKHQDETANSQTTQNTLQHTAPHCNTLQNVNDRCYTTAESRNRNATHIATHCNTLHHTATHCTTLQHTAPRKQQVVHQLKMQKKANISLQHTATHCNTLQHANDRWYTSSRLQVETVVISHCSHCNTLQLTATCKRQVVHQLKTTGGDCRNLTLLTLQHTTTHCNMQTTGGTPAQDYRWRLS